MGFGSDIEEAAEVLVSAIASAAPSSRSSGAPFELTAGPFGPSDLRVTSFRGHEELSGLFTFDVRFASTIDAMELEAATIGQDAQLSMVDAAGAPRVVRGIVAWIQPGRFSPLEHAQRFRLRIVPRLFLLTQRTTSRIYQNRTVPEIVTSLLDEYGIPYRQALFGTYSPREYCVQYQETDYAFVTRLLAEEGIFFTFEPPSALGADIPAAVSSIASAVAGAAGLGGVSGALGLSETVVLGDAATSYVPLGGSTPAISVSASVSASVSVGIGGVSADVSVGASVCAAPGLPFRDPDGMAVTYDHVSEFHLRRSLRTRSVLLRDYDFRKPLCPVVAKASAGPAAGITASASLGGVGVSLSAALPTVGGGNGRTTSQVYDHHGEYDSPTFDGPLAARYLDQVRRNEYVGKGESQCRRLSPGQVFGLEDHPCVSFNQPYVVLSVDHEGRIPARTAGKVDKAPYRNTFTCGLAGVAHRPARPRRVLQQVLETAVVVGPKQEEIFTDELGRIKVQFHWDLDGKRDENTTCWIRVSQAWAGAGWGIQFIPRVGMEVLVSFIGGDEDKPMVTGCVYNATHPVPFQLPADRTRSGIRTQSSPGGDGFNELSFEDAKSAEQIYLHAQRDLDEVVERHHTLAVKGDETLQIGGQQVMTVGHNRSEDVHGNLARKVRKDERVDVDGNRVDVVTGNADVRVSGMLTERATRETRTVSGRSDLIVGDDYTVRTKGCYTTIVGKDDAKRSYVLRVEGTAQFSASKGIEIDSEKGLTLKCGKSLLKISPDKIELVAPSVSMQGAGAGLSVAQDKLKISAKDEMVFKADKALIKTPFAAISLNNVAQITGKSVSMATPENAKEVVADTSPPPTTIQMKDSKGAPLANQRFVIKLGDGSEYSGILDKDGKIEMDLDGHGTISFPDMTKVS